MPSAMESKFYVWARGRWREVCSRSGRVQGAGKARFLFASGGRLHVARASRVLSGLRALVDCKPTSVRDGPPLPQRRWLFRRSGLTQRPRSRTRRRHRHCCCRSHSHRGKSPTDPPKGNTHPSPKRMDAAIQASEVTSAAVATNPAVASVATVDLPSKAIQPAKTASTPQRKRGDVSSSSDDSLPSSLKQQRSERYKELIIDESDVDLYRSYMLRREPAFDVYRFDTDDAYKLEVFYRINPLVALRRCRRLERMLAAGPRAASNQGELSLKDFATKLGLQSVSDQESEKSQRYRTRSRANRKPRKPSVEDKAVADTKSSDDTDKENNARHGDRNSAKPAGAPVDRTLRKRLMVEAVQRNVSKMSAASSQSGRSGKPAPLAAKPAAVAANSSSGSDDDFAKKQSSLANKPAPKKNPMKFLSQPAKLNPKWVGGGREYSSREDHVIVAFVSAGDRARRVNGNRLWQELQPLFPRLAGSSRSWHSLRNRYLRHLLPALGRLALPPAQTAALRAAAARGEIKRSSAPNPLTTEPRVRSAWGARPRPLPSRDSSEPPADSPEPPAESPEPPADSPEPPAEPLKPTLTSARRSPPPAAKRKRSPPAASNPRSRRREGTDSSASDTPAGGRRLLRSSGVRLPSSSPPPLPAPRALPRAAVRPRMRKLFNHNA